MVIDCDVIVRFLTRDNIKKADRFDKFLHSGKKGKLTDVTFAEIYWLLSSFYKLSKKKILMLLESLIGHSSIVCNKKLLLMTISILKNYNISFVDAYNSSFSLLKDDNKIMSYDRDFDKLPGIKRIEP